MSELMWLAGLLEGEGHFGLATENGRCCRPRVSLGMADEDVVRRAWALMGGSFHTTDRKPGVWKPMFHVAVSGESAVKLMQELLPYMGARRSARIAEVEQIYTDFWTRPCGYCATPFFAQQQGRNGKSVYCSVGCKTARVKEQRHAAHKRYKATKELAK